MTYFEQLLALPTVKVHNPPRAQQSIRVGTLAKLKAENDTTATLIFYGPDLGYELRGEGLEDADDYITLSLPLSSIQRTPTLLPMDRFVIAGMLTYPSIFPTREAVLSHAFLVLGNGYEWNTKGVLSERGGGGRDRIPAVFPRMSFEGTTMEEWSMRDFYERVARSVSEAEGATETFDEIIAEDFSKHVERAKAENATRQYRELFIDFWGTHRSTYNLREGHYENPISIANLMESKYLPMSSIPKCADRSFLEGMIEILNKAVVSARGYYRYNPDRDEPTEAMPTWLERRRQAAIKQESMTPEDSEKAAEHVKKNVIPACRYVEHVIDDIKGRIHTMGWDYFNVAKRALLAVGFPKKSYQDSSNGSGLASHYQPRALTDEDMATIDRRLSRKGFVKDGLTWTRADWFVTFRLIPVGDRYRASILIITHPEDRDALVATMRRAFDEGYMQGQRYEATRSLCHHRKIGLDEAREIANEMDELAIEAMLAKKPAPKPRHYD